MIWILVFTEMLSLHFSFELTNGLVKMSNTIWNNILSGYINHWETEIKRQKYHYKIRFSDKTEANKMSETRARKERIK